MITRPGHAGEPAVRLFAELAGDNIGLAATARWSDLARQADPAPLVC